MKKLVFSAIIIASGILSAQAFPAIPTEQQVKEEFEFLTSSYDLVRFAYQVSA